MRLPPLFYVNKAGTNLNCALDDYLGLIKNGKRFLFQASSQAQKAVNFLLEGPTQRYGVGARCFKTWLSVYPHLCSLNQSAPKGQ
jgi:antirestriction protein ArdC